MASAGDALSHPSSHPHQPVLVAEVLAHLGRPEFEGGARALVVDGTVGYGGHAEAFLRAWPSARLLGLDRDREALLATKARLATFGARARLFHASYADLPEVLEEAADGRPDVVLLDVGVSSPQLDRPGRGFSFRASEDVLDMRFDPTEGETAADLLSRLPERDLATLLFEEGGERHGRAVAKAIVRARAARPLRTVRDLVDVIESVVSRDRSGLHPATRTFQAIRIAVNREAEHLRRGLRVAIDALAPRGRLGVLTFHSGEERAVKEAFREAQARGAAVVVTKKAVGPTEAEVARNPRASSARLRVAEAVGGTGSA